MTQPFQFPYLPATDGIAPSGLDEARHVGLGDLRVGSTGQQVTFVQQVLLDAGVYTGEVDGIFGAKTEAAVRAWQAATGLPQTGVADGATLASLQQTQQVQPGQQVQQQSPQQQMPLLVLWGHLPLWQKAVVVAGVASLGYLVYGFAQRALGGAPVGKCSLLPGTESFVEGKVLGMREVA